MPDGVTLQHTATAIRTALVGKPMLYFDAPGLTGVVPSPGRIIERVSCQGKNVDVQWDDGVALHTQMRFSGVWHLYRPGERWRKPTSQLRVSIEVAQWVAVCFNAPVVETFRMFDRHRHPACGGLGPNVCDRGADLSECVGRLRSYHDPGAPVAEALVDERVLRGVGNVFRSELLWATELSPWTEVGQISDADARQIVNAAHRLLRERVGASGAFSAPDMTDHLNVYGRNGQRCARCGDTVEVSRIGELNRLLYWCPGCQVVPGEHASPSMSLADRLIDTHPAEAMYLSDLPWRQHDPSRLRPA